LPTETVFLPKTLPTSQSLPSTPLPLAPCRHPPTFPPSLTLARRCTISQIRVKCGKGHLSIPPPCHPALPTLGLFVKPTSLASSSGSDHCNIMDPLNARLDKMMRMMAKERAQRLVMEETLQKTQSPPQSHGWPTISLSHSLQCLPKPNPFMVPMVALQKRLLARLAFMLPKHFLTETSKVVFDILFMKDYAVTYSQPYLDKFFNRELVVFNNILNDFRSSFFDHNRQHCAKQQLLLLMAWCTQKSDGLSFCFFHKKKQAYGVELLLGEMELGRKIDNYD
ncbi:uncharacterized protein VP01_7832g1, partial [Puccinia sorghi]